MTTIFKNYNTNICFNGSYLFYEHNINVSYSIMIKLWTIQCYSINKLNGSLKLFAEFSLSAIISEKFPWVFQIFPDFSNFPNFSLIFQVLPECCEPCILYITYHYFNHSVVRIWGSEIVSLILWYFWYVDKKMFSISLQFIQIKIIKSSNQNHRKNYIWNI